MDMNQLAKQVTLGVGTGVPNVSLAQVRVVLKIVSRLCYKDSKVVEVLIRGGRKLVEG